MVGEKPIMNLNARMGFFIYFFFPVGCSWLGGTGLEGRAVPSLQSCPAGSQAISSALLCHQQRSRDHGARSHRQREGEAQQAEKNQNHFSNSELTY